MIKSISISIKNNLFYRFNDGELKENLNLNFQKGVNIITSPNGKGKSTLFNLMHERILGSNHQDTIDIETYYEQGDVHGNYFFVSIKDLDPGKQLHDINPYDDEFSTKTSFYFKRSQLSHGQSTNEVLLDVNELSKNADFIFIDEPELALDTLNFLDFIKKLEKLSNTTQFLIISHHPYLIFNNKFNIIELFDDKYLSKIKKKIKGLKIF